MSKANMFDDFDEQIKLDSIETEEDAKHFVDTLYPDSLSSSPVDLSTDARDRLMELLTKILPMPYVITVEDHYVDIEFRDSYYLYYSRH
jgi:hypothetical protein